MSGRTAIGPGEAATGPGTGGLLVGPPGPGPWCVPGCQVTDSWDHRCIARLATVPRTTGPDGEPRAVAVEVDQEAGGRRLVVLTDVDPRTGRYTGDPVELDPATVPALAAALIDAARVAR